MAAWPLICGNIYRLLLHNRWIDFDKTWQEASPQRPLSSLCFCADRKTKMAALASDWLKHFSTSSPQPVNGFWQNLTGKKSSTSSIKFVFLCRSEIQDRRPGFWLSETFFDFFSTTVGWILTKLDRNQILNTLYQVCVFCADRKSRMAALASDMLKRFSTYSPQPLNGFWRNLTWSKSSTPSIKFVFFVPIRNPRWPPWSLIWHAWSLWEDIPIAPCHDLDLWPTSLNFLVFLRHHPIFGIYQFHHVCLCVHPIAFL